MRQIYTSPRVENVERVVAMLAEAGIETRVTNRRSYAGHDYKGPSYTAKPNPEAWPQVWVVNAQDQPRARAMLRDAGIEPAVRYAEELALARAGSARERHSAWRGYIRLALIVAIIVIILLRALGVF